MRPACPASEHHGTWPVGSHLLEVRAKDAAGNVDPTPATFAWTVQAPPDTTAPQTTIDSGPAISRAPAAPWDLLVQRGRLHVRRARSIAQSFSSCSLAVAAQRPVRRRARVPSPRQGRRGQRRRDAGEPHLERRLPPPDTTIVTRARRRDRERPGREASRSRRTATARPSKVRARRRAGFAPCTSPARATAVSASATTTSRSARSARSATPDPSPASYGWTIGDMSPPVVTPSSPARTPSPRTPIRPSPSRSTIQPRCSSARSTAARRRSCTSAQESHRRPTCAAPTATRPARTRSRSRRPSSTSLVEAVPAVYEWTVEDLTAPTTTILTPTPDAEILIEHRPRSSRSPTTSRPRASSARSTARRSEPVRVAAAEPRGVQRPGGRGPHPCRCERSTRAPNARRHAEVLHVPTVVGPADDDHHRVPDDSEPASGTAPRKFHVLRRPVTALPSECSLDGAAFEPCHVAGHATADWLRARTRSKWSPRTGSPASISSRIPRPATSGPSTLPADTTAPETTIDSGPAASDDEHDRQPRLLRRRARLDVRVLARRRGLRGLLVAAGASRASRSARTRSRCVRPTRPATRTRARPCASGRSCRRRT